MSEKEFIIELKEENVYLIEDIIYKFPLIYNKLGKDALFNEQLNSHIIFKEFSEKDKNEAINYFLEKITNTLIIFLASINLHFNLQIKNIERKNISIQIKNNKTFISLGKVEVVVKIDNKQYKISAKKFSTIITFT